jgi:hypothetical protein
MKERKQTTEILILVKVVWNGINNLQYFLQRTEKGSTEKSFWSNPGSNKDNKWAIEAVTTMGETSFS